jgi:hypothetical protein
MMAMATISSNLKWSQVNGSMCRGLVPPNGTNVAVWHENGTDAQKWKLIAVGGGYYELEPKHAPGQRLDVAGAGTGDNNNVALYQQNGNDAQKWRFTLKNSSVPVAGSVYELSPKHATGLRLHETGIVPTADAVTVTADNSTRQQWKLINDGGGYYQLEPQSDVGKRLDVSGAGTTQGTNVAVWHQNGLDAQKWKLIAVGGGYYELEPKHAPGQRLDVAGAGTASPTNVYLWTQNGNDAQKWKFIFKSGARLAVEKSALMGDQLLAYPNPSSGKVTVTYQPNQHGRVSLHLYSSKGNSYGAYLRGKLWLANSSNTQWMPAPSHRASTCSNCLPRPAPSTRNSCLTNSDYVHHRKLRHGSALLPGHDALLGLLGQHAETGRLFLAL